MNSNLKSSVVESFSFFFDWLDIQFFDKWTKLYSIFMGHGKKLVSNLLLTINHANRWQCVVSCQHKHAHTHTHRSQKNNRSYWWTFELNFNVFRNDDVPFIYLFIHYHNHHHHQLWHTGDKIIFDYYYWLACHSSNRKKGVVKYVKKRECE